MDAAVSTIPVPRTLLRGGRRPRVALVGRLRTGKSTLFRAASNTSPQQQRLPHAGGDYRECVVDIGLEQISLVDLPSIGSLHALNEHDQVVVKYLLWGDRWPPVAAHEAEQPLAAF
ncbi:MAG TPA: FeoB small GTPase domain-containing protein, partial [Accumulibacter sp.]|nr:FeoB small GTPase domain-containing protein [Accumulibacter sp.]